MARQIKVTVVNDRPVCDPDTLKMQRGRRQRIVWLIQTPKWTFPADPEEGIVFKQNTNTFEEYDFDSSSNRRRLRMTNINDDNKLYSYTITLEKDGRRISEDPSIKNSTRGFTEQQALAIALGIAGAFVALALFAFRDHDRDDDR